MPIGITSTEAVELIDGSGQGDRRESIHDSGIVVRAWQGGHARDSPCCGSALFVFSLLLQSVVPRRAARPSTAASGLLADTVVGIRDRRRPEAGTTRARTPAASRRPALDQQPADGRRRTTGSTRTASPARAARTPPTRSCSRTRPIPVTSAPTPAATRKTTPATGTTSTPPGRTRKTDFKHIMAHASKRVGNSAFAYMGAERIVNNGTMVVDFELNKKPFKVFPAGEPPKPDRSDGDLLISLEYSNGGGNPIVTIYTIVERPELPERPDGRLRQGQRRDDADAVRSATNFVDLHEFGLRLHDPVPSTSPRRPSTSSKLGITTGCPGFSTRPHPQPHRRRPRQLAAQGHGPAVRHRPQQLRQRHDRQERGPEQRPGLRLHDDAAARR